MPIDEVFPRPLVKQVAFEVRYPNLFFIGEKIGEFQVAVMQHFPDSALLLRKNFVFAQRVPGAVSVGKDIVVPEPDPTHTVWQFKSPESVTLQVASDSFSVTSDSHKTYSHGATNRFRDVIELVCGAFFKLVPIPITTRVGLRYINHCPVDEKTTTSFRQLYNTALALDQFPLESCSEIEFSTVTCHDAIKLRYREQFPIAENKQELLLDLDAWAEKTKPGDILKVTDSLHNTISTQFEDFAKEPLFKYMRGKETTDK